MDQFFAWLGPRKCRKIRLAVMDMWKAFRKSTLKPDHAPQARIFYDKFHVLKHLNEALDKVRKSEYARLSGEDRRFIKGQKYTLLSRWENLSLEGKKALKLLFKANSRLNKAYLLKESFDQLWGYWSPGWAGRLLRPVEGGAAVAASGALPEVCPAGGVALGRHRLVLPTGEQADPPGVRRGLQQQDPRTPAPGVRSTG